MFRIPFHKFVSVFLMHIVIHNDITVPSVCMCVYERACVCVCVSVCMYLYGVYIIMCMCVYVIMCMCVYGCVRESIYAHVIQCNLINAVTGKVNLYTIMMS